MVCEYCGKEYHEKFGSGRFCSKHCARCYTSNLRKKTKICKCIDCGKEVEVKRETSIKNFRCVDCRKKYLQEKYKITYVPENTTRKPKYYCSICGKPIFKGIPGGCQNRFCQENSIHQFKKLIDYFGFDRSKLGTPEVEQETKRIRDLLYDLYWNKKMSGKDIAEYFHYDKKHSVIQNTFRYLKIPTRNFKESSKIAFEMGKHNQQSTLNDFKAQNHISWNNKKFYLKSSYEKDFAEELDKKKIDYQVEGLRIKYFDSIKNEYRTAIPDFYIKDQNLILEIKSPWTLNFQNMVDKENEYRKQGYNFRIIFEHEEYNSVKDINFSECRLKQNLDTSRFEKVRMYKQKDGFRWITKNGKTIRCNKNDVEEFIKNGWKIGRK